MSGVIALTFFALAFLAGFLSFSWRTYKRLYLNQRKTAEVIRYFCRKDSDGMNYYPILRLQNSKGDYVLAISPDVLNQKSIPTGSHVTVTYDPSRPKRAPIIDWTSNFLPQIFLGIFAVVTTWGAVENWLRLF